MLEARLLDLVLHRPLGSVVGRDVDRLLAHAEGAHQHEAPDCGLLRRCDQVARPLNHDPLDRLRIGEGRQRHQVHDGFAPVDGPHQAVRVGHVPLDDLAVGAAKRVVPLGPPGEHADAATLAAERPDYVRADKPGSSGDQDHPVASKFFQ